MKESDHSSVWERYVEAKKHAFEEEPPDGKAEPMTIEELERAIAEAAAASGVPETGMPPRASVHPTSRNTWSRWFYRLLVVLFIALIVLLFRWGQRLYQGN
ncbi:hypothetical protein [Cohnella nanjingensis]|uniref:Uncharacterized protein n=1 Tax=Cohnella nanjingensis TaxID=1387779 RepID=A0A7X0RUY6_9BACL|nr:hypothetical protein [Cohnella nanjingensis]MBB6674177.1 hypothetical protein [Cohnella nanjingensis]